MLPVKVLGNSKGPTLVFISGFPDNEVSAWGNTLLDLQKDYRCVCICYPDFETKDTLTNPSKSYKKWGYTFHEVLSMLDATIKENVKKDQKFHLLCHDWGAYIGCIYQNKHPDDVASLVLFDVGCGLQKSLMQTCIILLYQIWFAFAYVVSQTISNWLGSMIFYSFFLVSKYIGPTPDDMPPRRRREIKVELLYVYYQFWVMMLLSPIYSNMLIPKFPLCKTLFMYGSKKRAFFHSEKFFNFINSYKAAEGSKAMAVAGVGHWLQVDKSDFVIKELRSFIPL